MDRTPADKAGIKVEGENKRLTIIQNASRAKPSTEDSVPSPWWRGAHLTSTSPTTEKTAEPTLKDAHAISLLATRIIKNSAEAIGLDELDVRKILDGRDGWQVKGFVEAALEAAREGEALARVRAKVERRALALRKLAKDEVDGKVKGSGIQDAKGHLIMAHTLEKVLAEIDATTKAMSVLDVERRLGRTKAMNTASI